LRESGEAGAARALLQPLVMQSASSAPRRPPFGRSAERTPTVTSAQTEVLGTSIFHEEAGQGRPLVLLHGLNDTHRTWRPVLPQLARTRRVLVPDLPGCGLSGRPNASYALDWQARVINTWLGALRLEELDVVGHSYGGGVALQMLLLQPTRIRRLALVAAGGLGREVTYELRLASLPGVVEFFGQPFMVPLGARALRAGGGIVGAGEEEWLRKVNSRPGTARAFARTVRDVIDWRGQTRHFLDRAREIKLFPPVALFWGGDDPVIPHAQAITTLQILRGAQLTTLAGCGHFPHHQQPEEFVRELTTFLDTHHARPVRCVAPSPRLRWASRVAQALRGMFRPSREGELAS
jgi:pimeloyl-ACP methyl ester carboxylesterase